MPMMFASFQAGSLISLLIPIAVVVGLLVWHVRSLGRGPRGAVFPEAPGPGGYFQQAHNGTP